MLMTGTPIERVSILLGHSSVKVTERHYAPWVKERQAQLEADVARGWSVDPIAQDEQLRDEMLGLRLNGQRMAATPQRHEKGEAVN
jgi:hypothetical protein